MNEVSKCGEIIFSPFDNLQFPLEEVNIKIWVLKATVRNHLLSSILSMFKIAEGSVDVPTYQPFDFG